MAASPSSATTVVNMTPSSDKALEHLSCAVCLCFPEANVLQCTSGHIMCAECHARVCVEDKPTCPTCRMVLDPLHPIRNVLAEQTIALLPVPCPNEPCNAKCTRGSLATHLASECAYRQATCKYHPLGCKWTGLSRTVKRHEDKCKKADLPGWKLLKKVEDVQAEQAAAAERERRAAAANARIVAMMGTRCRNLEVSHVTLHKCSAHEHVNSKPAHLASAAFHAIGYRFKLFTMHDSSSGTYQVALQLRDSRTPLPVDFFVVGGPPASETRGIRPTMTSHTFDRQRDTRTSAPVAVCDGEVAAALGDLDSLVLRVGIADRRTGRLSRDFQGQPHGGGGGGYHGGGHDSADEHDMDEHDDDDPDGDGWDSENNSFSDEEDGDSVYGGGGGYGGGPPRDYYGGGGGGGRRY